MLSNKVFLAIAAITFCGTDIESVRMNKLCRVLRGEYQISDSQNYLKSDSLLLFKRFSSYPSRDPVNFRALSILGLRGGSDQEFQSKSEESEEQDTNSEKNGRKNPPDDIENDEGEVTFGHIVPNHRLCEAPDTQV